MNKLFKSTLAVAILGLGLSSCLKDKDYDNNVVGLDTNNSPKVLQIKEAPEGDVLFNVSTTPLTNTLLTISTGVDVTSDVTVTLVKDDVLATSAGYSILPAADYVLGGLTLTIPKGSRSVALPIKINNSSTLLGTSHALGFKISNISDASYAASANYKTVVCPIIVQNEYAGDYKVTGARYNYTGAFAYSFPGPVPAGFTQLAHPGTKTLYTVDANTSEIGVAGLAGLGYYYIITVPPGSSGEVVCPMAYSPLFNTDNSGIELKKSTYNTLTKTFEVVIRYLNGAGNTRIMVEKFQKL